MREGGREKEPGMEYSEEGREKSSSDPWWRPELGESQEFNQPPFSVLSELSALQWHLSSCSA